MDSDEIMMWSEVLGGPSNNDACEAYSDLNLGNDGRDAMVIAEDWPRPWSWLCMYGVCTEYLYFV
jgi:hypothetical protein